MTAKRPVREEWEQVRVKLDGAWTGVRRIGDDLAAENERLREALDAIATDATIIPEGCPEPWRSTLVEWAQLADRVLTGEGGR